MIRPYLIDIGIGRYMPVILLASFALCACTAEEPPRASTPRQVKVETVTTQPREGLRLIGVVQTQHRADLSFEFGGLLEQVLVRAGQDVRQGQILAQLDRRPAQLKLDQAKAQLATQKQQVIQSQQALERNRRLFADGTVAQKDVEQATAQYQASVAQRAIDDAAMQLAQRELAATQLKAPFDGRVVSYEAEPHTQISAAQAVIKLEASGNQDVVAQVPVEQARTLSVGGNALAYDASEAGAPLQLKLRSLSPAAKNGLLQEAKFEVISSATRLIDGTTLSVQVAPGTGAVVMTLPQQAFRGSLTTQHAEVFVYEPQIRQVVLRPVELGGLQGSRLIVRDGLAPGEQVVTAGAAFLSDRQTVSLFKPTTSGAAE
ncbi:efflux RND transporter periplasmic adaptor subunit [Pseudomonas sp. BGr12]|uniref:efflux RND transporter periplasmic adaptor subunit n=1 Tax=Pseudomonas sp. BGr12 TaxID=2936269 RepID=UPI00255A1202|nr:efflux RND transporter periplasmic adaptor subunit [Pseudomonas sp. BJa5]MDL2426305.1 efflux RND transporter periplasmic adaptor subunit [Pseudomonas sp. BJa5]